MGFMIVAVTNDKEHLYIYHGKDKQGVPILYGFMNSKNTKVYPRVFGNFSQAIDMADNIATYLNGTIYKSLKAEVWTDDEVENYLKVKFS
jgi:hypothetical protein